MTFNVRIEVWPLATRRHELMVGGRAKPGGWTTLLLGRRAGRLGCRGCEAAEWPSLAWFTIECNAGEAAGESWGRRGSESGSDEVEGLRLWYGRIEGTEEVSEGCIGRGGRRLEGAGSVGPAVASGA